MRACFKRENEKLAQEIIDRLVELHTGTGLPHTVECLALLRAIQNLASLPMTNDQVYFVIKEMKYENLKSINDFSIKNDLYMVRLEKHKRVASQQWIFVFPFGAELIDGVKNQVRFKINGCKVRLHRTKSISRWIKMAVDSSDRTKYIVGNVECLESQYPLCFSIIVFGSTFDRAWHIAATVFDTFRGSLELVESIGSISVSYPPNSRAKFLHPPWGLISRDRKHLESLTFPEVSNAGKFVPSKISSESLKSLEQYLTKFNESAKEKTARAVLVDCIRLYSQALDAKTDHHAFLSFWQVAEAFTLCTEHKGSKEIVCTRLSWFGAHLSIAPKLLIETLLFLYEKRNEIVHQGIASQVDGDDVNILKMICEKAIVWIWEHCHDFDSRSDLEMFFHYFRMSDGDTSRLKKILPKVEQQKEQFSLAKPRPASSGVHFTLHPPFERIG